MSLFLVIAILVPAALVVGAVFNVLWRARRSLTLELPWRVGSRSDC